MNESIIVIDDEPLILNTIERALSKTGYSVKTTSRVDDFINALSSSSFDLLIMDIHLGGVEPDALMAKVKALAPNAKILIISGSVTGLPEKHFLQKPFRIDNLRQTVRKMLDESA